jgi:XTP/dITP diphosphohydrolase
VLFVLASGNRHKLREFGAILAPHRVQLMPAGVVLPAEGTVSFAENAAAKARALAAGLAAAAPPAPTAAAALPAPPADRPPLGDDWLALGDDSGLEVEALGWAPGVVSSRYAGRDGDDQANIAKLLCGLAGCAGPGQRRARFVCALVAVAPDMRESAVIGEWWGTIAAEPHGGGGFGYDPVFVPGGSDLTVAQWPQAQKDQASHRALAGRALLDLLATEGVGYGP